MKTQKELKQAILDIIHDQYKRYYIGPLVITYLKEGGIDVALGFDNFEKPIHISAQLDEDSFLKYFKEEIRWKRLQDVHFYTGYRSDMIDPHHFHGYPINHTNCLDDQYLYKLNNN